MLNIKQSHMIISNQKTSKRFMHKTPWPDRSWPVNARKQPLLQKPQAVLDMPFITLVDPKICKYNSSTREFFEFYLGKRKKISI